MSAPVTVEALSAALCMPHKRTLAVVAHLDLRGLARRVDDGGVEKWVRADAVVDVRRPRRSIAARVVEALSAPATVADIVALLPGAKPSSVRSVLVGMANDGRLVRWRPASGRPVLLGLPGTLEAEFAARMAEIGRRPKRRGASLPDDRVLSALVGPMTVPEVAAALGTPPSETASLLNDLVRRGLAAKGGGAALAYGPAGADEAALAAHAAAFGAVRRKGRGRAAALLDRLSVPLSAADVSRLLGVSRQAADVALKNLVADGSARRWYSPSSRSTVYLAAAAAPPPGLVAFHEGKGAVKQTAAELLLSVLAEAPGDAAEAAARCGLTPGRVAAALRDLRASGEVATGLLGGREVLVAKAAAERHGVVLPRLATRTGRARRTPDCVVEKVWAMLDAPMGRPEIQAALGIPANRSNVVLSAMRDLVKDGVIRRWRSGLRVAYTRDDADPAALAAAGWEEFPFKGRVRRDPATRRQHDDRIVGMAAAADLRVGDIAEALAVNLDLAHHTASRLVREGRLERVALGGAAVAWRAAPGA
jgi:DNA-binding IclR family transcriptional regulator